METTPRHKQTLGAIAACLVIAFMGYLHLRLNMQHGILKGQYEELQRKYHVDSTAWDAKRLQDSAITHNCLDKLDSFQIVAGKQGYEIRVLKSQVYLLQKQLKRCRHGHRLLSGFSGARGSYTLADQSSSPPDYSFNTSSQGQLTLIHQALYRPASFSEGIDTGKDQRSAVPYNRPEGYYHRYYFAEESYYVPKRTSEIGIGPSVGQALTTDGNLITYIGIGFNFNVIKLK